MKLIDGKVAIVTGGASGIGHRLQVGRDVPAHRVPAVDPCGPGVDEVGRVPAPVGQQARTA